MISKEPEQPNRRYIAILSLPNRQYEVIISLRVIAKQSQFDHNIEDIQANQTLDKTPVSSTWKSGDLELTANAFYNEQKRLKKISIKVADFTSNDKNSINKFFSFLSPFKNEEIIELKSSGDFTVCGYMMLKMPSACPDDVLLFLHHVNYGENNNRQHVEGGVLLIKLSLANLSSTLSIFEDMGS